MARLPQAPSWSQMSARVHRTLSRPNLTTDGMASAVLEDVYRMMFHHHTSTASYQLEREAKARGDLDPKTVKWAVEYLRASPSWPGSGFLGVDENE